MIDSSFELEHPKRIYRQGLNLFTHPNESDSSLSPTGTTTAAKPDPALANEPKPADRRGAGDPLDPSTSNANNEEALKDSSNHTFYLKSSERRLRLVAKTERQQDQFVASIEKMVARTIWAGKNRFESFAPIRLNASAQWLIDGVSHLFSLLVIFWEQRADAESDAEGLLLEPVEGDHARQGQDLVRFPSFFFRS